MNENKSNVSSVLEAVDLYSIFRDTLRNLWIILLGAIAVGLIVNMSVRSDYKSTYSTSATFVVTSKTSSTNTYSNLSAASNMANSFSNILNSRLLKKKVCQDLGLENFDATAAASVISGTNLMTLKVTSATPKSTYQITRSIMKNITDLTVSVKEMAVQLKHMVIEQEKQGQRLEKIEASDGIMWRTVSTHAITAFVGGAIAFIVSKLF